MMGMRVSYVGVSGRSFVCPYPAFRYPARPLMQELFKAVAAHWREQNFGKEECANYFVGVLVSSGVEEGYTTDGVIFLMFIMRADVFFYFSRYIWRRSSRSDTYMPKT